MLRYIAGRTAQLIPVLLGVSLLVFLGLHLVPGDVAALMLGERATDAEIAQLRHELGLDRPLCVQYARFLREALRGNFGTSLRTRQPVLWEIGQALPITIQLSLTALTLAVALGLFIGVLAARHHHSILDTASMVGVLIGVSMPVFWIGILLLLLFGGILGWLPLGGLVDGGMPFHRITGMPVVDGILTGDRALLSSGLRHLLLPAVTLGAASLATIARMTRSSMLEVLGLDYIRTARAKGLAERRVINHHALRNALLPVVTLIGLQLGFMLSGAVLTEIIFSLPGLGRLAITSVLARDFPMVQGVVLVAAAVFVASNVLVDVLYAYLDPRIRYG